MRTQAGNKLLNVALRYQIYLERLKTGEVAKIDPVLRALDVAIRNALSGTGDKPTQREINILIAQLRKSFNSISAKQTETQLNSLRSLSNYATRFHAETIALVLPAAAPGIVTPLAASVWASTFAAPVQATGELLTPFVDSWSQRAFKRVEGAIRNGYAQGKTTQQIIQAIRGTKKANFLDGILGGVTKHEAASVVRTAIQQVSNQAQFSVYDSNSDIVEGYQWVSTLDSRTTSQCRSLDGRIFYFDEPGLKPRPPIHVNCRSFTIPKIVGIDLLEGTTRASKGSEGGQQVAANETYYSWLQKQPNYFQDDALGKTRAQLFRNGGLDAKEFARLELDKNFMPLTLEQMKAKNPAAFERAGITTP